MAANPERRVLVCDAALELLGREGSRGLTHRAVDREAGLAPGTTSNYFPSRTALFVGAAERLFVALAPQAERVEQLATLPVQDAGPAYAGYVVELLLSRPHLARAWLELRLEAMHSPQVAPLIGAVLREGFAADVAFHEERGLSGGSIVVRLLHHVVDGIVFDALTIPLDPSADPIGTAETAARSLLHTEND